MFNHEQLMVVILLKLSSVLNYFFQCLIMY